jgi:tetratricopeptide (TPR) repeat protein
MNKLIFLISIVLLTASCNRQKPVASVADYAIFLNKKFIEKDRQTAQQDFSFWQQKLQQDTSSYIYKLELAFQFLHRFKLDGTAQDIHTADSLFAISSAKLNHTNPEIFYSLSQNAITQHRFRDAFAYNQQALKKGGAMYTTNLLHFDAGMELGMYAEAKNKLERIQDKEGLDYLIRKAKYEDHKGNLDGAILLMEKALLEVKDLNKRSPYIWVMSNLADMYGHAGRIQESYNGYLDVLKNDSSNLYCLKGIAWIAYAHDKNSAEAKRILQYILSQTKMPDLYLTLAEIEKYEGNTKAAEKYEQLFLQEAQQPVYGAMYNKYLIDLFAEMPEQLSKAMALANEEVNSRPTPETFDWQAWVYFKKGDIAKAKEITTRYVLNKTFEPDAQLHSAIILAAAGETPKARALLNECLQSSFELGLVTANQINDHLKNL